MDNKKVAAMVVLVVVIVIAVVVIIKRTGSEAPAAMLPGGSDRVQMVDMKTFDVFTETSDDWAGKYAPDASGHYKNPKTGEYTVVKAMKCASCGQLIPVPDIPADLLPVAPPKGLVKGKPTVEQMAYARALAEARMKVLSEYKCPKCGKPAWTPGEGAAPAAAPEAAPKGPPPG